jgi:ABC-type spermidine/putrescine transport system permease subunit II
MFDRLKRTLVDSFVGAIALGYLFAEVVLYFVNVFTAPVAGWVRRKEFPGTTPTAGLSLQAAVLPLISFVVLLLIWYVLLRWLYFTPFKKEESDRATS